MTSEAAKLINEQVRRIRACLAEMGYTNPDLVVVTSTHDYPAFPYSYCIVDAVPVAVAYMAYVTALAGISHVACWSCYEPFMHGPKEADSTKCTKGNCQHPDGPKLPPRKLLRSPRAESTLS